MSINDSLNDMGRILEKFNLSKLTQKEIRKVLLSLLKTMNQ